MPDPSVPTFMEFIGELVANDQLEDYRFILTLGCGDGDHCTEIAHAVMVQVSLGADRSGLSVWIPFQCDQCAKPFRIAFFLGMPFYWDDQTSEHPQPEKSLSLAAHPKDT